MNIYFKIKHSNLSKQKLNFEFELKKNTVLNDTYLKAGTKLIIHGDARSCELLTQTLTSVSVDDNKSLSEPSPAQIDLEVWKFPRRLDPSQQQLEEFDPYDGASKTSEPLSDPLENKNSPTTAKKPSSKRTDQLDSQLSVVSAKLEYWYLPNYINTVFLIGENGSGKSLLLSRFCYKNDQILVIEPAKVLYKSESEGPYRGDFHKPMQPTEDDQKRIKGLTKDDEKMIRDRFKKITKQWEIEFKNGTVYFYKLSEEGIKAAIYLYESVSDGIRQIFRTILRYPDLKKYDIICLDEPESHLHPSLYCSLIQDIVLRLSVVVAHPIEKTPLSKKAKRKTKKKASAAPKAVTPFITTSTGAITTSEQQWQLRQEMQSTKLVIATHDFQLIDMLSRLPCVHGIVMEITSKPVPHAPKTTEELNRTSRPRGSDNQLNSSLWSVVDTKCSSDVIFDQTKNKHSLIEYSSSLLKCMANITPIVLFCEGNDEQSKDFKLYSLLFDPDKLKVQPSGKGYAEVRDKTNAAKKAKEILHQMTIPTRYYGICDRDRNLNIQFEDIAMLSVPEIENLYWIPPLWKYYKNILVELTCPSSEIVENYNQNKEKFWKEFSSFIKESLYYYLAEYAIASYQQKTKTMIPKLPSNTKDKRKELIDIVDKFVSGLHAETAEFSKEWNDVLEDAKKYSKAWEEVPKPASNEVFKAIYMSLSPTNMIEFNEYLTRESINTPKAYFQAFIQLSESTDEDHQGFTSYYYLLNEKRIIHFLSETIFQLRSYFYWTLSESRETESIAIQEAFTRMLKFPNEHVLRKKILHIFRDIFLKDFTYPAGDMKMDLFNSFHPCDDKP